MRRSLKHNLCLVCKKHSPPGWHLPPTSNLSKALRQRPNSTPTHDSKSVELPYNTLPTFRRYCTQPNNSKKHCRVQNVVRLPYHRKRHQGLTGRTHTRPQPTRISHGPQHITTPRALHHVAAHLSNSTPRSPSGPPAFSHPPSYPTNKPAGNTARVAKHTTIPRKTKT